MTSEFSPALRVAEWRPPEVVGRYTFYNQSAFDGGDVAANARDDAAIAVDKRPLLPGQAPSSENVTGYSRGINGVIIDVLNAPATTGLRLGDFTFRSGPGGDPSTWINFPTPNRFTVRPGAGAGGSDRVVITWGGGITNRWLQVTTKANANTGLERPDVFYFGNLLGETGDAASPLRVTAMDLAAVRRALGTTSTVTSAADVNRDGRVNAGDLAFVRSHLGDALAPLEWPVVTAPPLPASADAAASKRAGVWARLQES